MSELKVCGFCGAEELWVDCAACEDGYYDEYEYDPVNGHDYFQCPQCLGEGGYLECPFAEDHFSEDLKEQQR